VGSLFQEQKIFPVVVWGTPDTRRGIESIRNLLIDTPNGKWVRLGDVANVTINPTPNLIQHDTVSRYLDVTLNVSGQNRYDIVNNIKQALQTITFPLEYRAEVLGNYQSQHLAYNKLIALTLTALVLIFFLFQAAFESFRLSALILLTLPSALLGGVIVGLTNSTITYASLLGLITVYGLATRNSISQIKHFQYLEGKEKISEEKISSQKFIGLGATERFSPIIIATLAIAFLLLPFAVSPHLSGLEITSPMALIILGGLITTMLFNLFVVPSLYLWVGVGSARNAAEKNKQLENDAEITSEIEQESQDFRR
jgi:Cu/Ag efflux pump CusA